MSTSHPHTGAEPEPDTAAGRRGSHARTAAEDFPFTVRELRNHLERLGYRVRAGQLGGEDVRDMQARVAAFRNSLYRRDRSPPSEPGNAEHRAHAARTRSYERRIHAALADMAIEFGDQVSQGQRPLGLDVTSRAWLDQRFTSLRDRLEDALAHNPPRPQDDICNALEDARQRLNAMERRIEDTAERQEDAQRDIFHLIEARMQEPESPASEPRIASLDERLKGLQSSFDQAMTELDSMKTGTQRLAVRASATVARETARATAQHVARTVREAVPERRFDRLEEGLNECMEETRSLRHEAGVIHQTLEDGLDDLRGRINELTLICRKVLTPQVESAGQEAAATASGAPPTRPTRPEAPARRRSPHPQGSHSAPQASAATIARSGTSLISRLGFAVVVGLLIAASFAMLYAQLSGGGWHLPKMGERAVAPATAFARPARSGVLSYEEGLAHGARAMAGRPRRA